jgi:hypothetical protein
MTGWPRAARASGPDKLGDLAAKYPVVDGADDIDSFPAGSSLPIHFVHHRSRVKDSYVPSPPERPGWLKLVRRCRILLGRPRPPPTARSTISPSSHGAKQHLYTLSPLISHFNCAEDALPIKRRKKIGEMAIRPGPF